MNKSKPHCHSTMKLDRVNKRYPLGTFT